MDYTNSKRSIYNKFLIPTLLEKGFENENIKDNVEIIIDNTNTSTVYMIIYSYKYNRPLISIDYFSIFEDKKSSMRKAKLMAELMDCPFALSTNGKEYYLYNLHTKKEIIYDSFTFPNKTFFEKDKYGFKYKKSYLGEEIQPLDINEVYLYITLLIIIIISILLWQLSNYFIIITIILLKLTFTKRKIQRKYNPKRKIELFLNNKEEEF